MTEASPLPDHVAEAFAAIPQNARASLMAARRLIFEAAKDTGVGALTETLKWGQPSYLTDASKSGTTIRLGVSGGAPAVFFNCQTTLVEGFRSDFPEAFEYVGSRALILHEPVDPSALSICLSRALTYHRDKRHKRVTV